jgi:hypothetical protein
MSGDTFPEHVDVGAVQVAFYLNDREAITGVVRHVHSLASRC